MVLIKIAFLVVFIVGMAFIVNPIVSRLAVSITMLRRNRFYGKRHKRGRADAENEANLLKHPIITKLDEYLSVAEIRIPAVYVLVLSLLILVGSFLFAYKIMPAPFYNAVIGILFSCIPLLWCWSRYQKKTLAMASVMVPTIQNFVGYFSSSDNYESAIYKSARTVPYEIISEWNRLIMDLQTGDRPEKSLIQFADRVGNEWAQYFADILITHMETGVDITSSLFKLINEMQQTMYNEEKRITLLTVYKWGTFLMIGLSAFVVYFNIRMDPANYDYYFHDPTGIQVVTLSVVVLFLSFIGALQMGRKKL